MLFHFSLLVIPFASAGIFKALKSDDFELVAPDPQRVNSPFSVASTLSQRPASTHNLGNNPTVRIGEVLRYAGDKNPVPITVDGLPNFWHQTATSGMTRAQLDAGIDAIRQIGSPDGKRVPAILLSSSPHKAGSEVTPWHDSIDSDVGYALYYGDAKVHHAHALVPDGNNELIAAFRRHSSPDKRDRLLAEPLIIFERVPRPGWLPPSGRRNDDKGYVRFSGIGIVERVRLVTQLDAKTQRTFANYVFELLIFDLSHEGEAFCWDWVSARRNEDLSDSDCLTLAPKSWQIWVKEGSRSYPRVRRSVAKSMVVSTKDQQLESGSKDAKILDEILSYYEKKKHRFEALAELVAESVLGAGSGKYHLGWISRRGHDFGIDFVGRLDIGDGFARTSLIVLGQAKCERRVTSARDIARTVARLQRGWFGCYVTTSEFSTSVQKEVKTNSQLP